jgi:hypothetical protein
MCEHSNACPTCLTCIEVETSCLSITNRYLSLQAASPCSGTPNTPQRNSSARRQHHFTTRDAHTYSISYQPAPTHAPMNLPWGTCFPPTTNCSSHSEEASGPSLNAMPVGNPSQKKVSVPNRPKFPNKLSHAPSSVGADTCTEAHVISEATPRTSKWESTWHTKALCFTLLSQFAHAEAQPMPAEGLSCGTLMSACRRGHLSRANPPSHPGRRSRPACVATAPQPALREKEDRNNP